MGVVEATASTLELHDYVALADGRRGTIVDVYPERDTFTIEIADDEGRTVELIPAHRKDLRLLERVG